MRVRMRPFCNSVMVRACCVSRFCVSLVRVLEQLLNAADVVRRFGEAARELLDRGVAVELERIEVALLALLFFEAMQDLRFGFELELAQLFLEARDGARQLADVEVDGTDLLFETGARDARFAGIVEQLVEQLGVDAREFGTIGRRGRFAARRHCARRQQRSVAGASASLFAPSRLNPRTPGSLAAARVTMDGGSDEGAHTAASTGGSGAGSTRGGGGTYAGLGAARRKSSDRPRAGLGAGAGCGGAGATMGGGGGTAGTGAGAATAGAGAACRQCNRRAQAAVQREPRRPALPLTSA